eukprot:TRINITY_DN7371_c0_g1_i1.p1 TRINITY_DN7371_c0_g1~~TRINITY_DN7371_c0_g1_i1.p1  ORF type:complete len:195 (+),score=30.37 TRINITY_DN7371_c0_g1_i1:28-612(+)
MLSSSTGQAVAAIVLHVVNYNATAHIEYKTRTFNKIIGRHTIYAYAVYLVISALVRDFFIHRALESANDTIPIFPADVAYYLGNSLFYLGVALNLWTLYALGIKGMYNGDSFGWLMDAPVVNGPYAYFSDPQYVGTTVAALGHAVMFQKLTGYALTILVGVVFYISAKYVESPHLRWIYSHRKESTLYPTKKKQ